MHELLTADQTFVNERLARHYGMGAVHGPQFRRVTVEDDARRGLLGKGAVLLRTSYGDRTSPVLRGAWVLDKLMGTPPTPPPPNVETDLSTPPGARSRRRSARGSSSIARTRTARPATASSTRTAWRSRTSRRPASGATFDRVAEEQIDATTVLPSGQVDQWADRAAASAAAPPGSVRAGADDEAHDVCARARARVFRHAASARRRARGRGRRLPVRVRSWPASSIATRSACRRCRMRTRVK